MDPLPEYMNALPLRRPAIKALAAFITAREKHRKAKERGHWTGLGKPDPIIVRYRFCNVRRNDDRVSRYVMQEFLPHFSSNEWFAATVARLFNNEDTLEDIVKFTVPFKAQQMRLALHARKTQGCKNFNAAYIVSTNGRAMDKIDYVIDLVLTPLWEKRSALNAALRGATLEQAHDLLMRQQGLGSFMAAQVLADLKYVEPERWSDFHTFAASGPGSKRGLNRVVGRDKEKPMREDVFRATLAELRIGVQMVLNWDEPLTAQDLQNCLCEYDKYERARTGEGTPKQIYKPLK